MNHSSSSSVTHKLGKTCLIVDAVALRAGGEALGVASNTRRSFGASWLNHKNLQYFEDSKPSIELFSHEMS